MFSLRTHFGITKADLLRELGPGTRIELIVVYFGVCNVYHDSSVNFGLPEPPLITTALMVSNRHIPEVVQEETTVYVG